MLPRTLLSHLMSSLLFLSLFTQISDVLGFQCYVCDSKNDIECVENLTPNSRLMPQDCNNITEATYCIKTTNIYAGELGTKRFCAANDHGNHCDYVKQPTGDRFYRSCVLTCSSENCNGSNALRDRLSEFYVTATLILFTNVHSMVNFFYERFR